jgi:hypothetical protein
MARMSMWDLVAWLPLELHASASLDRLWILTGNWSFLDEH